MKQGHIADFRLIETLKQKEQKQYRTTLPENVILKGRGMCEVLIYFNM